MKAQVVVGFIPLLDCAPLIAAVEQGFAAQEGLELTLMRETSWANIRDRVAVGWTQRELAKRVGTSASAICRLEASDYEGHSLYMLKRIAEALERRIEIRFVPVRRKQLKTA